MPNMIATFYSNIIIYFVLFVVLINHRIYTFVGGSRNTNENLFNTFSQKLSLSSLPDYVVANISNLQAIQRSSIRRKTPLCDFPLSEQDILDLKVLETKFENEKECAGLAAPQIGISKRFIIFKVDKEDVEEDWFPKTIWINPVYEKASDVTEVAYEQCFSVLGVTGPVRRHKHIRYRATNINGELVEGTAEGWAARVIQHETDHLDGILFIDLVPRNKIITLEAFRKKLREYEEEEKRNKKKLTVNQT